MQPLLEAMPVKVILNDKTALIGAARCRRGADPARVAAELAVSHAANVAARQSGLFVWSREDEMAHAADGRAGSSHRSSNSRSATVWRSCWRRCSAH